MTILEPKIYKLIKDEQEKIVREQVVNWLMGFCAGRLETAYFNGKKICYSGIEFSGSPQHVFWGRYIEPYLEDITGRLIKEISNDCVENKLDLKTELKTLKVNLENFYIHIFYEMVNVEQRLLGKGYPNRINKRNVTKEIAGMNIYLDKHINMEISKKTKNSICGIKSFLKKIWGDPVWSKVISAIIITIFGWSVHAFYKFLVTANMFP